MVRCLAGDVAKTLASSHDTALKISRPPATQTRVKPTSSRFTGPNTPDTTSTRIPTRGHTPIASERSSPTRRRECVVECCQCNVQLLARYWQRTGLVHRESTRVPARRITRVERRERRPRSKSSKARRKIGVPSSSVTRTPVSPRLRLARKSCRTRCDARPRPPSPCAPRRAHEPERSRCLLSVKNR